MKTRILISVFALLVCVGPAALGQDSSSTRTLASILPFRGIHIDWGSASVPYLDKDGSSANAPGPDIRLSLPLRRWPDWSIAVAANTVQSGTTDYIAPGSSAMVSGGYHPPLTSVSSSFEIERRWSQKRMLHSIASAGIGTIDNFYDYWVTSQGVTTQHQDEKTTTTFATIAGGGELNIARWLRASLLVGYRSGGRMAIAGAKGSNGGMTTSFHLELGKF